MLSKTAVAKGSENRLAKSLGWLSLGLGAAGLFAPGGLSRITGVPRSAGLFRLMGLREIASGVGLFRQRRPAGALWSRVGGDMMDLGLLSAALVSGRSKRLRVLATMAAMAGLTRLDLYSSQRAARKPKTKRERRPRGREEAPSFPAS